VYFFATFLINITMITSGASATKAIQNHIATDPPLLTSHHTTGPLGAHCKTTLRRLRFWSVDALPVQGSFVFMCIRSVLSCRSRVFYTFMERPGSGWIGTGAWHWKAGLHTIGNPHCP
jgi:hypothetical protein